MITFAAAYCTLCAVLCALMLLHAQDALKRQAKHDAEWLKTFRNEAKTQRENIEIMGRLAERACEAARMVEAKP